MGKNNRMLQGGVREEAHVFFTSVSAAGEEKLIRAIHRLAEHGIRRIELTAGLACESDWQEQARKLQQQYRLTYRIHHFFPPSEESFYLNLGSQDERVWKLSLRKARECLQMAKTLGDGVYGIHAPVFADPIFLEGRMLWLCRYCPIMVADRVLSRFWNSLAELHDEYPEVDIYVENNCWSLAHFQEFNGEPIAAFLDNSFLDNFAAEVASPMCDIGHLFTVCERRGLDFHAELIGFAKHIDYWHINGNDGKRDGHGPLLSSSPFLQADVVAILKRHSSLELVVETASLADESQTKALLIQALR